METTMIYRQCCSHKGLILWLISGALLFICLVTGLGQPVLTKIGEEKIAEAARSKYNQSVYDLWRQGQDTIASLQGQPKQTQAETPAPSLLASWKWWLLFIFSFMVALINSFVSASRRAIQGAKTTAAKIPFTEIGQKISDYIKSYLETRKQTSKNDTENVSAMKIKDSFWKIFSSDLLANMTWDQILSKPFADIKNRIRRWLT